MNSALHRNANKFWRHYYFSFTPGDYIKNWWIKYLFGNIHRLPCAFFDELLWVFHVVWLNISHSQPNIYLPPKHEKCVKESVGLEFLCNYHCYTLIQLNYSYLCEAVRLLKIKIEKVWSVESSSQVCLIMCKCEVY